MFEKVLLRSAQSAWHASQSAWHCNWRASAGWTWNRTWLKKPRSDQSSLSIRTSFLKISCQVSSSNTFVFCFLCLLSLLLLLFCILFLQHKDQTLFGFNAPIRQISRVVAELHFDLEDRKDWKLISTWILVSTTIMPGLSTVFEQM